MRRRSRTSENLITQVSGTPGPTAPSSKVLRSVTAGLAGLPPLLTFQQVAQAQAYQPPQAAPIPAAFAAYKQPIQAFNKVTNATWRQGLMHTWDRLYAQDPTRSQWWALSGHPDEGFQCAIAEAVVIRQTEKALGIDWVHDPRIVNAYAENKDWAFWRVAFDGSFTQWAQNPANDVNGHSRFHAAGTGSGPQPGDLIIYGSPGTHVVMYAGHGKIFGADDGGGTSNGNAHRPIGNFSAYINMDLPYTVQVPNPQASPAQSRPVAQPSQGSVANSGGGAQAFAAASIPGADAKPAPTGAAPVAGGVAPIPGATVLAATTAVQAPAYGNSTPAPSGGAGSQAAAIPGASVGHTDPPKVSGKPYTQFHPALPKVPPPHASGSNAAFINSVAPGAMRAQQLYGIPASVTIAQAINESGWGDSSLAYRDHNLFGIKGSGPAGSDMLPTQEYQGGGWVTVTAPFRVYHNVGESIVDHAQVLHNGYYNAALAAWRHNPTDRGADQFANDLTRVYATSPSYGKSLIGLMRTYKLYQYNHAAAAAQHAQPAHQQQSRPAPATPSTPAPVGSVAPIPGASLVSARTSPAPAASPPMRVTLMAVVQHTGHQVPLVRLSQSAGGAASASPSAVRQATQWHAGSVHVSIAKNMQGLNSSLYAEVAQSVGLRGWQLLAAAHYAENGAHRSKDPTNGAPINKKELPLRLVEFAVRLVSVGYWIGINVGLPIPGWTSPERDLTVEQLAKLFGAFKLGGEILTNRYDVMGIAYNMAGMPGGPRPDHGLGAVPATLKLVTA